MVNIFHHLMPLVTFWSPHISQKANIIKVMWHRQTSCSILFHVILQSKHFHTCSLFYCWYVHLCNWKDSPPDIRSTSLQEQSVDLIFLEWKPVSYILYTLYIHEPQNQTFLAKIRKKSLFLFCLGGFFTSRNQSNGFSLNCIKPLSEGKQIFKTGSCSDVFLILNLYID